MAFFMALPGRFFPVLPEGFLPGFCWRFLDNSFSFFFVCLYLSDCQPETGSSHILSLISQGIYPGISSQMPPEFPPGIFRGIYSENPPRISTLTSPGILSETSSGIFSAITPGICFLGFFPGNLPLIPWVSLGASRWIPSGFSPALCQEFLQDFIFRKFR